MAEHVVQFPLLYQHLILKSYNLIAQIFVLQNVLFNNQINQIAGTSINKLFSCSSNIPRGL